MSAKPRLLLAGGGHADIPMIRAAKALGFHVITSGNKPSELGHAHGDEYQAGDFSDREAMLALAQRNRVAAICANCNDFSALSTAWVAERLGLHGHDPHEVAEIIHHKDRWRRFAQEHGVPSPRAVCCTRSDEALAATASLAFPLFVKPVDLTGGKGISAIRDPREAAAAIERAFAISRVKRIVVEELVEGSRHGWSAFLRDGRVVFDFSDDEHYYCNPYMVSAASTPTSAPETAIAELRCEAERIAGLLRLGTGIFHVQYILRGGRPVIIEICRRPPGDLYVELVRHATGVDYPAFLVRAEAGLDCSALAPAPVACCMSRHCVMSDRPGRVRGLTIDPAIAPLIVDRMLWWKPGEEIADHLTWKAGIVFVRFPDPAALRRDAPRLHELIRVELE